MPRPASLLVLGVFLAASAGAEPAGKPRAERAKPPRERGPVSTAPAVGGPPPLPPEVVCALGLDEAQETREEKGRILRVLCTGPRVTDWIVVLVAKPEDGELARSLLSAAAPTRPDGSSPLDGAAHGVFTVDELLKNVGSSLGRALAARPKEAAPAIESGEVLKKLAGKFQADLQGHFAVVYHFHYPRPLSPAPDAPRRER